MAIPDAKPAGLDAYRALLRNLEGVFAANVIANEAGGITEIHILAGSSRNPKQISRDVISALSSAYGLQIDHRLISIAQLKEDPTPAAPEVIAPSRETRLRSGRLTQSSDGVNYSVTVSLCYEEAVFTGEASGRDSEPQRQYAVARAVLAAVHAFLGREHVFSLLAVHKIQLMPVPVYVTVVESALGAGSTLLVGAAAERAGEALTVERATLDALNRTIPALTLERNEG